MSQKVVFIINSAQNQRCIKRVEEFKLHGYDVQAYAISRNTEIRNDNIPFKLNIIAKYDNTLPYSKRLKILLKSVREIYQETKDTDALYYYFGLDIAMISNLIIKRTYIYEESDLQHTYINSKLVRNTFEWIDKRVIKKSLISVFTSEGFLEYHYKQRLYPQNTQIIPNRLHPSILTLPEIKKRQFNSKALKIGFVGSPRFKSVAKIAEFTVEYNKNFEFHFYGKSGVEDEHHFNNIRNHPRIIFHGPFKNPKDLPEIYAQIDIVVSTYDVEYDNVRYAEPNKIYEAIYFRTPIIVSSGTFLAKKVCNLGIGYAVNPLDKTEVFHLLEKITKEGIQKIINKIEDIDKKEAINNNVEFFKRIEGIICR